MQSNNSLFHNILTLRYRDGELEKKYFQRITNPVRKLLIISLIYLILFTALMLVYYIDIMHIIFIQIHELVLTTLFPIILVITVILVITLRPNTQRKFFILSFIVHTSYYMLFNHIYLVIIAIPWVDNNWLFLACFFELLFSFVNVYYMEYDFLRNFISFILAIAYSAMVIVRSGTKIELFLGLLFVRLMYIVILYSFTKSHKQMFFYFLQIKAEKMRAQNLIENMKCGFITFDSSFKNITYNNMVSSIFKDFKNNDMVRKYLFSEFELVWKDEKLSELLTKVDVTDDYDQVIGFLKGREEFRDFVLLGIKRDINLIVQIFIRYNELSDNFEIILNDITAFAKREELATQTHYKTLFLSKICHEFRNPISNIIYLSELQEEMFTRVADGTERRDKRKLSFIKEDRKGRSKTTGYMQGLNPNGMNEAELNLFERAKMLESRVRSYESKFSNIREIARLMNLQILDFEMISNSISQPDAPLHINITNLKLYKLIDDCIEMFNTKIKLNSKNIKITKSVSEFLPDVYSDENKLRQIIINLLSNCYKFTFCGTIHIQAELLKDEVTEANKFVQIKVTDTGMGIDENKLKHLRKFTPFTKFEKIQNKYGLGLGLSVVKHLVELIGTDLEITSTQHEGTSVSFKIPYRNERKSSLVRKSDIISRTVHLSTTTLRTLPPDIKAFMPEINLRAIRSSENLKENANDNTAIINSLNESTETARVSYFPIFNSDIIDEIYKNDISDSSSKSDEEEDMVYDYCVLIVEDELVLRKAHAQLLQSFFSNIRKTVQIIECEDGADALYQIYTCNKNGKQIDLILSDESMNFMRGSLLYQNLKNLIKENVLKEQNFYLVTSYENFTTDSIDKKIVINKPLTLNKLAKIKGSFLKR
jgi:signal transduction histidine kinase